jgi:hypothetical protein
MVEATALASVAELSGGVKWDDYFFYQVMD